jgi:hypothetical protein
MLYCFDGNAIISLIGFSLKSLFSKNYIYT